MRPAAPTRGGCEKKPRICNSACAISPAGYQLPLVNTATKAIRAGIMTTTLKPAVKYHDDRERVSNGIFSAYSEVRTVTINAVVPFVDTTVQELPQLAHPKSRCAIEFRPAALSVLAVRDSPAPQSLLGQVH